MCYTPETECNLMKGYTYGVLFSTWQKCVSILMYTVKPVSRGHLWDKKKWPYKTGDFLKNVPIHMKIFMTEQEKDVLSMQVTA